MKRTIVSAVAVAGALALGACGSTATETAGEASTSAAAPAAAGGSVGDTVTLADLAASMSAAVKDKGSAHVQVEVPDQGAMEADVDYSGDAPAMSMSTTQSGESVQVLYVDKVLYLSSDSMSEVAQGKKWLKIVPDGEDMMSQMMGSTLEQMESSMGNPADQLGALQDTPATVTDVDGDSVTYTVTLTKAQLKKQLQSKAETIPGLSEDSIEQLPDGVSYELTVDGESLPTALSMDVGGQTMTMTYSKWGEPVEVSAPPAAEVGSFEMPTS
ncbi:hypothetical protein H9L10_10105 [Phycicoccus endophyticus]|uniref:LppX_LprAFG lipoprotein n=1 Tax=Phycicoccus endophyticus TaxID=1690220 RepID=A0A7G9QZ90_9MICO|nr:hypothetical protein [Phycicoccus endophyticus]NHI19012.1 hypothetical protein [Phycicoccus endophyticus]QNN48665.1 hypothetical protein H9L10_10105 [Phycicoccus endophyticus]GGL32114.1 hypothetical protein GCM10012283_13100 [Phycicoccus endophyticus]